MDAAAVAMKHDDEELVAVSAAELMEQKFLQQQRVENNETENHKEIDEIEQTADNNFVLRCSHEGETDLLGRPMRPYITPLSRPVMAAGNTQLSFAQARLFGLLDENGEVRSVDTMQAESSATAAAKHQATMESVKNLSGPRELDLSHIEVPEDAELKFKPTRSAAADKAMRNPRLGYDFIDRLEGGGDFMERMSAEPAKGSKKEKKELQSAKDDYTALLDKLACLNCKAEQSFDEYHEKIRECRRCKEKFVKVKVCNAAAFERQQKEQEEKRQKKLRELEEAMYGSVGKMASKPSDRLRQLGQSRAAAAASSVAAVPVRTCTYTFVWLIFVRARTMATNLHSLLVVSCSLSSPSNFVPSFVILYFFSCRLWWTVVMCRLVEAGAARVVAVVEQAEVQHPNRKDKERRQDQRWPLSRQCSNNNKPATPRSQQQSFKNLSTYSS